jgi:hypothetical protein
MSLPPHRVDYSPLIDRPPITCAGAIFRSGVTL